MAGPRRRRTRARRPPDAVAIPGGRVALSTASVYPESTATAFGIASRLGYDGIEVMVWTDPVSQEAGALRALADLHGQPIVSVHAPTLLLTQRIWGPDPWTKVDRSLELAGEVGASTVVVHPPFRWQKDYARDFVDGVRERERTSGIAIAVENMFPWRARGREVLAYLPHWDPLGQDYDHVTLDLSHTATAGIDGLDMMRQLGSRLRHLHLADGSGTARDEHLVPGRGSQPCGEVLEALSVSGYTGDVVLEVGTRRLSPNDREIDLSEALAFARLHFASRLIR
ncbi:MAG: sugar phosphate isomerase/epimerase [Tetrasphaera sp.]